MRIDRERLLRLATFWLRPDFVLRVVARFQSIAGFDRAIALASSALTAMIPLTIFVGALLGASTADRIITRYNLSGNGAAAVEDAFKPASSVDTRLGILGALLLLLAVLSFARTVQRLFEQTWELPPLSVRNTVNGIKWLGGVVAYFALVGTVHAAIGRGAAELVATVILGAVRGRLSRLVRPAVERRAAGVARPAAVRDHRLGAALALWDRRDGLRPARVRHLCRAVWRDRRRVRPDLDAVRRDGRACRIGGARPRGSR